MYFTGKTKAQVNSERYEAELAACKRTRMEAYRDESDPLFFDWQRGEITKETWLARVTEIKTRYPKPEAPQ